MGQFPSARLAEEVHVLGLVLLRLVRVVCLGNSRSDWRSIGRVYRCARHSRAPTSRRFLALHFQLLRFPLALFGSLQFFIL